MTFPQTLLPLPQNIWSILMILGDGVPRHGYAINKQLKAQGLTALSGATLYRSLRIMLGLDLIEETAPPPDEQRNGPRRRYYQPTTFAQTIIQMEIKRVEDAKQKPLYQGLNE